MILEKITANRVLVKADLEPVQGDRFQPTGFANLGAALYTRPDGTRMLLVESAQSMANRLERTILTSDGELVKDVEGLSYVRATLTGDGIPHIRVSSLTEAHRLASPYIIAHRDFKEEFCRAADYDPDSPLNWRRIHEALFRYDVNSLLHGVFLSILDKGKIKTPRLISAFIEATDVREAVSGGVKNTFDPKGTIRNVEYTKNVYRNVPFQRTEYTAAAITAYFNLDAASIRRLGLPETAQELLVCLGLYKMRLLLEGDLRLRTACDLRLKGEIQVTEGMAALPDTETLLKALKEAIASCRSLFADPPIKELTTLAERVTGDDDNDEDSEEAGNEDE